MTIKRYSLQRYKHGTEEEYVLYADHVAEVCRYRDKILEVCKACQTCDGAGIVTTKNLPPFAPTITDCPECLDLRELLA
jgi:hypothetical protein